VGEGVGNGGPEEDGEEEGGAGGEREAEGEWERPPEPEPEPEPSSHVLSLLLCGTPTAHQWHTQWHEQQGDFWQGTDSGAKTYGCRKSTPEPGRLTARKASLALPKTGATAPVLCARSSLNAIPYCTAT